MTRLFKNILNCLCWNLWSNIILILMWLAVEERISFSSKSCNNVKRKNCFNEEDYTNNHKQPNRHHNLLKLIVKVTSTLLYRWDCRQNRLMIIPKRHFQHIHLICYYIHRHNCSASTYMRHFEIYDLYVFISLFFIISLPLGWISLNVDKSN